MDKRGGGNRGKGRGGGGGGGGSGGGGARGGRGGGGGGQRGGRDQGEGRGRGGDRGGGGNSSQPRQTQNQPQGNFGSQQARSGFPGAIDSVRIDAQGAPIPQQPPAQRLQGPVPIDVFDINGVDRSNNRLGADRYTINDELFSPNNVPQPSQAITTKEDKLIESNKKGGIAGLSISGTVFPVRPSYGTQGKRVILRANYFHVDIETKKELNKYVVSVKATKEQKDPPERGRLRRQLFACLFQDTDFTSLGEGYATDYASTIITSPKLPFGSGGVKTYSVPYHEADGDQRVLKTYEVTLKDQGRVNTEELLNYLNSSSTDPRNWDTVNDAISALNIVVARKPNMDDNIFQSGRNKFFRFNMNYADTRIYDRFNLSEGLIAVRGYYSSLRLTTGRVLLNVNAQSSAFYPTLKMHELMDKHGVMDKRGLGDFIAKVRVRTEYLKGEDGKRQVKVKTVHGLSRTPYAAPPSAITFDFNGRQISVEQYFKNTYSITLRHKTFPCLNCGTDARPCWIPPELCEVMPGQAYRGKLSSSQTAEMIKFAAKPPPENAGRIAEQGLDVIGAGPTPHPGLAKFGISVNPQMVTVIGRMLEAPSVKYHGKVVKPFLASWNMLSHKFVSTTKLKDWGCVKLGNGRIVKENVIQMREAFQKVGLTSEDPIFYNQDLGRGEQDMDNAIQEVLREVAKAHRTIVLVALPSSDSILYARVKYWADVKFGIHTVCVDTTKSGKWDAQFWTNVALKFNLKNGGVNHTIEDNAFGFLKKEATMVVGIDVTHPSPGSPPEAPSIAAVVASVDASYANWPASFEIQQSRKEMVTNVGRLLVSRLILWSSKNRGTLPRNILIFRDGVSEGQYETVLDEELGGEAGIKKMIKQHYGKQPMPKISIIVVGKRHHTRFYATDLNDTDRTIARNGQVKTSKNPKPGVVVDRGVTLPKIWDFYMQPHKALQGTARPAHYIVIHDEIKLQVHQLENLIHGLCYTQQRACKGVSICPPAFYADRVCERARCYLQQHLAHLASARPPTPFQEGTSPWKEGCHERIRNAMFYM